jgi:enoyl-CoA hydratase/carnithine racemase
MAEEIVSHVDGGILRIEINRPEKKNALTAAMYSAMADALERGQNDPAVRVVLIHGQQDIFTAPQAAWVQRPQRKRGLPL